MDLATEIRFHDRTFQMPRDRIMASERWGYDAVFGAGEGAGPDALTPLAHIAGFTTRLKLGTRVAKILGRSATTTAMTFQTIDQIAGGNRVMIGLGSSDRRYAMGWFDEPWVNPVERMRDYVAVIRQVNSGQPVRHEGPTISIPSEPDGEAMAARMDTNADVPILLAANGPKMIELTAEIADGWLPGAFRPGMLDHYRNALEAGFSKAAGSKGLEGFQIWGHVDVNVDDDVHAAMLPFKQYVCTYPEYQLGLMALGGFGHEAEIIRDVFEDRHGAGSSQAFHRPEEAPALNDPILDLVPDDYIDSGWLCGPTSRFTRLLEPWIASGLTGLVVRYGEQTGHPSGVDHYENLLAFREVARVLDKPGSD